MNPKISRRSFLKGTAAGALTLAGAGLVGSAFAESAAADEIAWDAEYDVVVLGYGGAGANAAVAACEGGAKVLLTDKAPAGLEGGNTQASGQFVMATDDPEQLYTYLTTLMGKFNNWDDEAVRAYCEGCAGNFAWMTGPMGGDPELICPVEHPTSPMENLPNTKDAWSERENAWGLGRKGYIYCWQEFPEYESGKHCLCLTASGTRFDRSYYNLCQAAVAAHSEIDVWNAAPGKKLLVDAQGVVIGAVIEKDGKLMNVKAKGGVILATGGFEHNKEMVASYLQQPYVFQRGGLYNDGDGVKMATAVGADLWHMSNSAGFSWTYKNPALSTVGLAGPNAKLGVIVGLGGGRFMNEAAENRHGRMNIGGRWISTPMPLPSYIVHDADQLAAKAVSTFSEGYVEEIKSGEVLTGNTLEELAEAIRQSNGGKDSPDFNTDTFVAAIAAYNKRFDAGEDADYGRPFATMVPVKNGPFYAIKIGPTYFNTMGGPRRNKDAQVINVEGYPVEGLFSAGELGSIFCDMYNGSGNLGETMVFGRIAGQNAAKRAKGEYTSASEPVHTWQGEEEVEAKAELLAGTYKDGVYEGTGTGFAGPITVQVTIEGGKVAKVDVLSQNETPNIGGVALPEYCNAVIESQGLDVDVVASASNTLRGFQEAVNDAVKKAL